MKMTAGIFSGPTVSTVDADTLFTLTKPMSDSILNHGLKRHVGNECVRQIGIGRNPDTNSVLTLALGVIMTAGAAMWAQNTDAPDVPYPRDFRSWRHVKSIVIGPEHKSFPNRGGIHHYYANELALEGYRTGTFPNGSVIVDEAVFTKDGTDQAKGTLVEGDRRALDVMVKNDQRYKETGGWGFEHFDRDSTKSMLSGDGSCQVLRMPLDRGARSRVQHDSDVTGGITMTALVLLIRHRVALAMCALTFVIFCVAAQQYAMARGGTGHQGHTMVSPDSVKYGPVNAGISSAVLWGSPSTEGSPFVVRIKMTDGAKVPPHWHPVDEHLTVVSGTFHMGIGETFDESAAKAMTVGSYGMMPKDVRHFAWATGETVVQVHGIGPFKTTFVSQTNK
jgi:quercetin dioxygenase-like cupin family protein